VEDQAGEEDDATEDMDEEIAQGGTTGGAASAREEAEEGTKREEFPEKEQAQEIPGQDDTHGGTCIEETSGEVECPIFSDDVEDSDEGEQGEDVKEDETPGINPAENQLEVEQIDAPVKAAGQVAEIEKRESG